MPAAPILIDFLIPQFQDERILNAIRSIIDHPEAERFRIIVLDGGQKVELQAAIKATLRNSDVHRVASDRGIYDALNAGLGIATADWVGWIGSDDLLAATFSSHPLVEAKEDIRFLSYVTLFFRESDGKVSRVYRPASSRFLRRNGFHLPHFSTFIRTETAKSFKFDITQKSFADQLFMYDMEQKHRGDVSDIVATLMCQGGLSNSSRSAIVYTNIEVVRAISTRKTRFGSLAYITFKLSYKIQQRLLAISRPSNISTYRIVSSLIN